MSIVLKGISHGIRGEKMKFNGRHLRMTVFRFGGYAPLRRKIKIKAENISIIVWGESDRLDAKIFGAIKGETVFQCIYVTAAIGLMGRTKTFRFEVLRKYLLGKRERTKEMEQAIEFARKVASSIGLSESTGANSSIIWSRGSVGINQANLIASLDTAADDTSDDAEFTDDEPDSD